jgi:PAS domain S-box-containing protein
MNNVDLTLASSSWLKNILDHTPDAIVIADPDLKIVKWNPALEDLLPAKPDMLTGKNVIDVLQHLCCDGFGINGKIQQALKNGFLEEDMFLIRSDGKLLQLTCHVHKIPGTNMLSAVIVIIQDLQKQVNRNFPKTSNNESIYSSFLENSLAPAWITDEDGFVLFVNERARQIWKLDNNYRFKHTYDLFPRHMAEEFIASDKMVLVSNQPIAFVIESMRENDATGYYLLHKFLLPLNTNRRLIAGQAIDITAEKEAQEALRKSSERFSYVAKALSDCIWDWDMETGKIYRSEALMTLTGYTREEIEDTPDWWEERTHPDDRKISMDKIKAFIMQGHPYCDAEYRFLCAGNNYRYFADKGYVIYESGKPVRAIGIVHDITEKKKLEAKLLYEKIQKEKEITRAVIAAQDLVSNELAKELHDNVNQILCTANLILEHSQEPRCEAGEDYVNKSKEYIVLAINEIRKISKSMNTSRVKEVLLTPVEEIVSNLRLSLQLDVQFDFDPAMEKILSPQQKLMVFRIVQEQTNNIIKYAGANRVAIAVNKKNNYLHLEIRDNGKGFNLKEANNGIGLTNIRNRVEAFSGTLNIITSAGQGCSMEIVVPLEMSLPARLLNEAG